MTSAPVLSSEEARQRVVEAIRGVVEAPPAAEPWLADLRAFLASFETVGESRLFHVEERPARFLTPLKMGRHVGALVASDPFTGEVLAWPGWMPGLKPAYLLTEEEMLELVARDHPRTHEVIPTRLDRSNRFAVTPADLERATLIEGWDRVPYKNQEERLDWVERVNASGVMRTKWRQSPGMQEPAYKCLSYASSTVADWWGWRLGTPPAGRYQSLVNGLVEYGLDPRELETLYHHRARRNPVRYARLPPAGKGLDPVTRERIPSSLRGYATLLTSPESQELKDPLYRTDPREYSYWPGKYHMDGPPRLLFTGGRQDEAAILDALQNHGIVMAMTQTRLFGMVRVGLHAIAIVGWFERRGKIALVYHESYGNKAAGYLWDGSGGPGLMSIETRLLRGAVAFPHHAWFDLEDERTLSAKHSEGGTLDAAGDLAVTADGRPVDWSPHLPSLPACRVDLQLSHRHFFDRAGQPVRLTLPWPGPGERGAAFPVLRWLTLTRQLRARRPSPEPKWIGEALDGCRDAFARWAERAGPRNAEARLAGWRARLLAELSRGDRAALVAAFPVLR